MRVDSDHLFHDIGEIKKANTSFTDIKNDLEDIFEYTKMSNNYIEEPRKRVLFEKENSGSESKLPQGPVLWKKPGGDVNLNEISKKGDSQSDYKNVGKGQVRSKTDLSKVFKYILFLYLAATVFFSIYKAITYFTTS